MCPIKSLKKSKKGLSMIEMVIVISIISVVILTGIFSSVKAVGEARVAQVESDLSQYSISLTTFMIEDTTLPTLDTQSDRTEFDTVIRELNQVLPTDYKILTASQVPSEGSVRDTLASTTTYISQRRDPWGNNYCISIDTQERNVGTTEYFITVMSAGKNAKANIGGVLDKDDIFLLAHYHNGFTENHVYRMEDHEKDKTGTPLLIGVTSLSPGGGAGSPPRNIGRPMRADITSGGIEIHVHDFVVSDSTQATCTSTGWQQERCSICGYIKTSELSVTSHKFILAQRAVSTATGTESYNLYECSSCKTTEERDLLPNFRLTSSTKGDFGFKDTEGESLVLPDEFINRNTKKKQRLISMEANAFSDCDGLKAIGIPNSVQSIGKNAFSGCTNLNTVYFYGSKQEWDNIDINETGNNALLNATFVFIEA